MPKEMTHRDEIHGDLSYDPLAVALIDTPTLQRLGRLHQLGYAHLVYRGGNHTRLSHVMGAYGTARRLVDALHHNHTRRTPAQGSAKPEEFLPRSKASVPPSAPGDGQMDLVVAPAPGASGDLAARWEVLRHLVGWAALLHDIAHIPYGHTLEDEYNEFYAKHDAFTSSRLWGLWSQTTRGKSPIRRIFDDEELYPEAFGTLKIPRDDVFNVVLLICMFSENLTHRKVGDSFENRLKAATGPMVAQLQTSYADLKGSLFHPYMADIVANTISADYLDYLRRDPHNLGLDVLRDDRVVSRFWVGRDSAQTFRMALSLRDDRGKRRLDTCTGVVELVRQRYRFAEIVYYHKAKIAASAMLAKVLELLDPPSDEPPTREPLEVSDAQTAVSSLLGTKGQARSKALAELRLRVLPQTLLDPAIGDDSLHLFLLHAAIDKLDAAVAADNAEEAAKCYRAIALVHALCERRLYKVAFTLDADQFRKRVERESRDDASRETIEANLETLIRSLKGDRFPAKDAADRRRALERAMETAAGFPENSLIIYVSPWRNQAKGIETGALTPQEVVTLGEHPAVERDVKSLSERYKELWKLFVLVHPSLVGRDVALSDAADHLVKEVLHFEPNDDTVAAEIADSAWFYYMRAKHRKTATQRFRALNPGDTREHLIGHYYDLVQEHVAPDDLAVGATLWRLLLDRPLTPEAAQQVMNEHFADPEELQRRVETKRTSAAKWSREGEEGAAEMQKILRAIIDELRLDG